MSDDRVEEKQAVKNMLEAFKYRQSGYEDELKNVQAKYQEAKNREGDLLNLMSNLSDNIRFLEQQGNSIAFDLRDVAKRKNES